MAFPAKAFVNPFSMHTKLEVLGIILKNSLKITHHVRGIWAIDQKNQIKPWFLVWQPFDAQGAVQHAEYSWYVPFNIEQNHNKQLQREEYSIEYSAHHQQLIY